MIHIYVDGSYNTKTEHSGWGFVVLTENEKRIIHEEYGKTSFPAFSRQIDGEVLATKKALIWASENNQLDIKLFFDYKGNEKWFTGEWRGKSKVAKSYVKFAERFKEENENMKIDFIHVKSHTGNKWNDYADTLADKGKYL